MLPLDPRPDRRVDHGKVYTFTRLARPKSVDIMLQTLGKVGLEGYHSRRYHS